MINSLKLRWMEWLGAFICFGVITVDSLHVSGGGERNLFLISILLFISLLIAVTGTVIRKQKLKGMPKPHISLRKLRQKYFILLIMLPVFVFYFTNLYFFHAIVISIGIILVIMLVDYIKNNRLKNREYQSS